MLTIWMLQYSPALNNESTSPILFRYAEVLLTIAEINMEKDENTSEVFDILDELRLRGGHIVVDSHPRAFQVQHAVMDQSGKC